MEAIKNFDELIDHLRIRGNRKRVAVVWPEDQATQMAVSRALEVGFIDSVMVGCKEQCLSNKVLMRHSDNITFVEAADSDEAAAKAVKLVRDGNADILMKGMLNTDNLLRAILNKEYGILPKGNVLTHITASEIPAYPKLLFFSDSAVIPYPTLDQRAAQIKYLAYVARAFGIAQPKIALLHCSEKVDERHFPFTVGFKELIARACNGEFGPCIVDGPMDVKTACSYKSMLKKHIESPINGEADALLFPDIEAANMFYKTIGLFCGASTAAVLQGTVAPVVLPSRGDSIMSKLYSLALAAL
ncbi:MAG: phosphate butyryltransferase [Muribaculaceae bacterium]|nr:phosphate butyryltransferase [Muribaculaceae bacterium]MDE6320971.1 phosphate butyryltransferase [Muribaculaceae bacterium]